MTVIDLRDQIKTEYPRKDSWLAQCIKGPTGAPLPIVANVLTAMRRAPELFDLFAFDEMARVPMMVRQLDDLLGGQAEPRPLTDEDVTRVQEWLQQAGLKKIARETVRDAVNLTAKENAFHPVRDWLRTLVWDGQRRANIWLTTRIGVEPCRVGFVEGVHHAHG
jgi:hypothetical protein